LALAAINHNGSGKLTSIDLPLSKTDKSDVVGTKWPLDIPIGFHIPKEFNKFHNLILDDAFNALPDLILEMVDSSVVLDMFIHDSDHSYGHMMFEFSVIQRYCASMKRSVAIISDDVLENRAFKEFFRNSPHFSHPNNRNLGISSATPERSHC